MSAYEPIKSINWAPPASRKAITDAAIEHLRGIHTLNMTGRDGITDAALVHLRGAHKLDVSMCRRITSDGLGRAGFIRFYEPYDDRHCVQSKIVQQQRILALYTTGSST